MTVCLLFLLTTCSEVTVEELPPVLNFDFTQSLFPAGLTFTRNSSATYIDAAGIVRTAAAHSPRFDHDPVTGMLRGLLIEERRTNLIPYSEAFDRWVKANVAIRSDSDPSPLSTVTADLLVPTAGEGQHVVSEMSASASIDTFYTVSCYVKPKEYKYLGLYITSSASNQIAEKAGYIFDLLNNKVLNASGQSTRQLFSPRIQRLKNDYYRCSFTVRLPPSMNIAVSLQIRPDFSASETFIADGISGGYVWGAQFEMGGSLTSYIPTTSGPARRETDVCLIDNTTNWFNQSEGTWIAETELGVKRVGRIVGYDWPGNFLGISPAGPVGTETWNGKVNVVQKGQQTTGVVRHGMTYTRTSRTITREGLPPVTSQTPNGNVTQVAVGANADGREALNAHVRKIRYYAYKMPDELLQRKTQ